MSDQLCHCRIDSAGTATISLNRPDVHNAIDERLVNSLLDSLKSVDENSAVRTVILASNGKYFCAGIDLNWMARSAAYSRTENRVDALRIMELMQTLYNLSKPTIAMIKGPAYGGGVGLVACCDIAIASERAAFCFSEVRLGLIPSVISPYVVKKLGDRAVRRYFLTGEVFNAEEARRIGLVHEISDENDLHTRVDEIVQALRAGGPIAQTRTKKLLDDVSNNPLTDSLLRKTAQWIADVRQCEEAKEGIQAFLEKRDPQWALE